MRVAVSALGTTLDDRVDERFGRAAYILMVDPETLEFEAVDNQANRNAMQGAGLGTAEAVASRGVEAVITGHLGPKAFKALSVAGVSGYGATGMIVRDAVKAFGEGRLESLGEGEAHAGLS